MVGLLSASIALPVIFFLLFFLQARKAMAGTHCSFLAHGACVHTGKVPVCAMGPCGWQLATAGQHWLG